MTPKRLRDLLLGFPAAVAEQPFSRHPEVTVVKVGGKMFALTEFDAEPLTVSLKCDPAEALRLRDDYPSIVGGYHLNKRHWNTVILDGSVPGDLVEEMVTDSYDLVVAGLPKAARP